MRKLFESLLQGYKTFKKKYVQNSSKLLKQLAHGQQPEVMVVACCDSRIDPAILLQADPGDIFSMRTIATIIPPYVKSSNYHGVGAALEYGVTVLNVKHLILLGHSNCGGVAERLQQNLHGKNDFLDSWLSFIDKDTFQSDDIDACTKEVLQQSLENTMSYPWVKKRAEKGDLQLHSWFFDIETGSIISQGKDLIGS